MFCCVNKKILTSVIEPSPAFQPKKDRFLLTNPHPMAELIKALQPLKPLKSNPLNDSAKPVNNNHSK
jgi:hypothetical protein